MLIEPVVASVLEIVENSKLSDGMNSKLLDGVDTLSKVALDV